MVGRARVEVLETRGHTAGLEIVGSQAEATVVAHQQAEVQAVVALETLED